MYWDSTEVFFIFTRSQWHWSPASLESCFSCFEAKGLVNVICKWFFNSHQKLFAPQLAAVANGSISPFDWFDVVCTFYSFSCIVGKYSLLTLKWGYVDPFWSKICNELIKSAKMFAKNPLALHQWIHHTHASLHDLENWSLKSFFVSNLSFEVRDWS